MTLTRAQSVATLGAVIAAALVVCARNFGSRGAPSFLVPLAIAGVAHLVAVRELFVAAALPRHVVVIGLALAASWRALFFVAPPGPDDDVHRYVWDGRLQRLGHDPHVVVPQDPAYRALHTPVTLTLNNPEVPSPYPAGAELFFRGVTAFGETVWALKAAFAACDLVLIVALWLVLRGGGRPPHLVLVYAWHPLVAVEAIGSGHVDVVGALALLLSFGALATNRRAVAAVTFAIAVMVKPLPIVLLPLYVGRVRVRDALLAVTVVAVLQLPFGAGRGSSGSLAAYVQRFRFNGPVFAALERFATPSWLAGFATIVGLLVATMVARRAGPPSAEAFAWPMAAALLCAPVIYPWYLLWLLPFVRSASSWPVLVWSVSVIPTYVVWHLRTLGRPWVVPRWATLLEFGCVAAAALASLQARRHLAARSIQRTTCVASTQERAT